MLIDAHMHISVRDWRPEPTMWSRALKEARSTWPFGDPDKLYAQIKENPGDPEGKKWAKDMEYLGIDVSVNLHNDWGSAEGWLGEEASISNEEINRQYCLLAQKYKGKFFTFIGVNPRRRNAVELLEKGVKEWGAKGLKLIPHTGFYPNERVCYRLYEKCAELGVPVCIHTGAGVHRYSKYSYPIYLDEPAHDFPELEFIMAHITGGIGLPWQEACNIARFNPNINVDLAEVALGVIKGGTRGNKGKYKDHTPAFMDMLDILRNWLPGGCASILFGTDYPWVRMEVTKAWVDLFKNLPAIADEYGYEFSQEEVDLMCGGNAVRIMKLDIT